MKYLVVDSGPLIKGARIEIAQARTYITVPEVLREIRDRQARSGMQLLPFELATKEPSDEAIARGARGEGWPPPQTRGSRPWPRAHCALTRADAMPNARARSARAQSRRLRARRGTTPPCLAWT